jgi:ubiquinone/menaquinone biosynthesis C-methylase UbiE
MTTLYNPRDYEAWYHTLRGAWIGDVEFTLMMKLLQPIPGASVLDVGSGTGYFSRRFAASGFQVTGLDPNREATAYAIGLSQSVDYISGSVLALPFDDYSFDYCAAVTSLCFIEPVELALAEMWRVARRGVVLGLLNHHSLLYLQKHERKGYRGARWDTAKEVQSWWRCLDPPPQVTVRTAIFFSNGGKIARVAEQILPNYLPWGGFLAIALRK